MQNLGSYIKYVHVKDSVIVDNQCEYRFMGDGDMPIRNMLDALSNIGYDEFISLEWVKRWSSELSDAELVFPKFANYMQDYFAENEKRQLSFRRIMQKLGDMCGKRSSLLTLLSLMFLTKWLRYSQTGVLL